MLSSRTSLIALAALLVTVATDAADQPVPSAPSSAPAGTRATRDQLRECLNTEDGLKERERALQAASAENRKTGARLEAEGDQMRGTGSKMDETNPVSATAYDAMVKTHNLRVRQLNAAEAVLVPVSKAFVADLTAFQASCSGLTYLVEDMEAVAREREKATAQASAASSRL